MKTDRCCPFQYRFGEEQSQPAFCSHAPTWPSNRYGLGVLLVKCEVRARSGKRVDYTVSWAAHIMTVMQMAITIILN
jgi:hypothetical protein